MQVKRHAHQAPQPYPVLPSSKGKRTSRTGQAAAHGGGLSGAAGLLGAYERHLRTQRGVSDLTVRNYLADLIPFGQYLERQGLPLSDDARALRAFIERAGPEHAGREYRSLVRDYVSWLLERRLLTSGRRAEQHGHARASVVRALAGLRSFMRYLIGQRLVPDAPLWAPRATLMQRFTPKTALRLPDVLTPQDAAALVEAPASASRLTSPADAALRLRDAALLELLYGGGLRVSEAAGLDVDHVSLQRRTVLLRGKGSKERQVPLGRVATAALNSYLAEGRPALAGSQSGTALFLNNRGGRLTVRSVQGMVRRYAAAAGLREGVHPHTLRHSYATHLLDGGADLRIVQELLGHSSPSATQVYTHISQQEARRVYLTAHPLAKSAE
ncbi:MAG: tyrosine-type recombinase/integrase [Dehalococcoidia bacterium]